MSEEERARERKRLLAKLAKEKKIICFLEGLKSKENPTEEDVAKVDALREERGMEREKEWDAFFKGCGPWPKGSNEPEPDSKPIVIMKGGKLFFKISRMKNASASSSFGSFPDASVPSSSSSMPPQT